MRAEKAKGRHLCTIDIKVSNATYIVQVYNTNGVSTMPRKTTREKISWTSVNVPSDLIMQVIKYVSENPQEGYSSHSEFVRVAIREKLDSEYAKTKQNKVQVIGIGRQ